MPGLRRELHCRLKEVHVQPSAAVEPLQTLQGGPGGVAVISHETTHHVAVLLLDVTAIVLLVGTRAGEGDLLLTAVVVEVLVDEFAAVVRVDTEEGEGKTASDPMYAGLYTHLSFPPHRLALRPASIDVYRAYRVQVKALSTFTAVRYQVYFYKPGLVLLPIGKSPDRDCILQ